MHHWHNKRSASCNCVRNFSCIKVSSALSSFERIINKERSCHVQRTLYLRFIFRHVRHVLVLQPVLQRLYSLWVPLQRRESSGVSQECA